MNKFYININKTDHDNAIKDIELKFGIKFKFTDIDIVNGNIVLPKIYSIILTDHKPIPEKLEVYYYRNSESSFRQTYRADKYEEYIDCI